MARVLVTGGAGYVGSHIVRRLVEEGREVVVLDDLSEGHRAAVDGVTFVEGNLGDPAVIDRALGTGDIEFVVHMAASCLVGESVAHPARYYRNNVIDPLALLDAARQRGVKGVVFSSSAAVYGEPTEIPNAAGAHPDGDIGEDHAEESHLVPRLLQAILHRSDPVPIFGADYPTSDGTCVRDYVHVVDLAEAHVLALGALERGAIDATAFNLGNGEGFTVNEVIATVTKVAGEPPPVVRAERRPGDPAVLVASAERAKRELGWSPRHPVLADIVASAWRWHRAHPHGYGKA
jgi:UDP-glucose 4-epimerase